MEAMQLVHIVQDSQSHHVLKNHQSERTTFFTSRGGVFRVDLEQLPKQCQRKKMTRSGERQGHTSDEQNELSKLYRKKKSIIFLSTLLNNKFKTPLCLSYLWDWDAGDELYGTGLGCPSAALGCWRSCSPWHQKAAANSWEMTTAGGICGFVPLARAG